MRHARWRLGVLTGVTSLVCAWGCGEGKPSVESSTTEATVTGKVTIRGKLATRGTVSFNPANYQRKYEIPRGAEIRKDGSYTVTTLIGGNVVFVETPETVRDPKLNTFSQSFNVESGTNTFNIELPPSQP